MNGPQTSLKEMVTFSWNLDLSTVTPSGFGGNCATARLAKPPSSTPADNMVRCINWYSLEADYQHSNEAKFSLDASRGGSA